MEQEHAPVVDHSATTGAADSAHAADALHASGPLPSVNLLGWNLDLNDPTFWAFIGLLIFIGLIVYMKVPKTITKSLDDRSAKITSDLAAAEALRREAEAKLAEVQKRAAEAEADAKAIVENARREADQLAVQAEGALAARIASREKLAEERISRAESDAIRDVKLAAVQTASRAAAAILTEQLSGKAGDDEFAKGLAAATKALS
jgi:F-type H+-transporting ATPase subunit b